MTGFVVVVMLLFVRTVFAELLFARVSGVLDNKEAAVATFNALVVAVPLCSAFATAAAIDEDNFWIAFEYCCLSTLDSTTFFPPPEIDFISPRNSAFAPLAVIVFPMITLKSFFVRTAATDAKSSSSIPFFLIPDLKNFLPFTVTILPTPACCNPFMFVFITLRTSLCLFCVENLAIFLIRFSCVENLAIFLICSEVNFVALLTPFSIPTKLLIPLILLFPLNSFTLISPNLPAKTETAFPFFNTETFFATPIIPLLVLKIMSVTIRPPFPTFRVPRREI